MGISINGDEYQIVRLSFPGAQLARYLDRGLKDEGIFARERDGVELVQSNFSPELTDRFVREVCKWGGYAGVAGKVLRANRIEDVVSTMRVSYAATQEGDLERAISAITSLRGLAVSFGSKHLKFLDPNNHVVLDRIIRERLGDPRTIGGYCEFNADCASLRDAVNGEGYRRSDGRPFRIADVEMAVFQMLGDG